MVPAVDRDHLDGGVRGRMRRQMMIAEAALPLQDLLIGIRVNGKRLGRVDMMHVPFRRAGILLLREGVAVLAAERILHVRFAPDVDGVPLREVECAGVVEPARMIFVVVCQEYGVQVMHVLPQHLGAEIGAGVHQDRQAAVLDQGRGAQALVARVGRAAHLAVAGDHRDAIGSPCAEKGQFRFLLHNQSITMSASVPTSAGS